VIESPEEEEEDEEGKDDDTIKLSKLD